MRRVLGVATQATDRFQRTALRAGAEPERYPVLDLCDLRGIDEWRTGCQT